MNYEDLADIMRMYFAREDTSGLQAKSVTWNREKGITTVVLRNGKKGLSKVAEGDVYDEKVGFALAYCYALFGSKTKFNSQIERMSLGKKSHVK